MTDYYRPLVQFGPNRSADAVVLAGGDMWFSQAALLGRGGRRDIVAISAIPDSVLARLTAPRAAIAGLSFERPLLMGILNVTPDSFSDGGQFNTPATAFAQAQAMVRDGADIIDIGGESTRPGAQTVDDDAEITRTAPVIAAIRRGGYSGPISIDTRKARVARAALGAGADMVNDVSAMTYDTEMASLVAQGNWPVVLMHAKGTPDVMQTAPSYGDVLFDVYDALAARVDYATAAGISRDRIIVDPGIGFGKTAEHNLTLLADLALFHGLGCTLLLGASRKRFIGTLGNAPNAQDRGPGSVAVALAGVAQGVQMLRVHDIADTRQALTLWWAAMTGDRA